MVNLNSKQIVLMVTTLIIIVAVLPIGLGLMSVIGDAPVTHTLVNGTAVTEALSEIVSPTVLMLLTTLVPILIVIGIALYFIPRQ